jgi:hypothetical protein
MPLLLAVVAALLKIYGPLMKRLSRKQFSAASYPLLALLGMKPIPPLPIL